MARFSFYPFPSYGHIVQLRRTVRELEGLGHSCRVLAEGTLLTAERCVASLRGCEVVPVNLGVEEWLSNGASPATLIDRVAGLLDGVGVDLLVVDAMMEGVTTAAWLCGYPVVQFSTTIDQYIDGNRYPASEFLKPNDPEESIRAARRTLSEASPECVDTPWTWAGDVLSRIDEFPFDRTLGRHVATPPTLKIACCPDELDFPQERRTVRYLSPGPPEVEALPESLRELASSSPIYVSFGSLAMFRPMALELAEALADAFPDHAIVCSADDADAASGSKPANLHTFRWLSQGALLPHCACFVSHGGFNGVFESICAGTPLVIVPFGFDQPGLAARVEYHDAGLAILPDREQGIDVDAVVRAVAEVMSSERIRAGMARLRSACCRPSEIASYLHQEALGDDGNLRLARAGQRAGDLVRRRSWPGAGGRVDGGDTGGPADREPG